MTAPLMNKKLTYRPSDFLPVTLLATSSSILTTHPGTGMKTVKELDDRMWLSERRITQPMLTKEDDYDGPLDEFPLTDEEYLEFFTPWPAEVAEFEYHVALRAAFPEVR